MFKFEKYQCAILGPSSSDSAANIEKKFGKTISWVCMDFKKKTSRKSEILIKTRLILPKLVLLTKKLSFLYLNKNC